MRIRHECPCCSTLVETEDDATEATCWECGAQFSIEHGEVQSGTWGKQQRD